LILVYGGKPEIILRLTLEKEILSFISPAILSELTEVLVKKFKADQKRVVSIERLIESNFSIVRPKETISEVRDEKDNRILEAALEGNCAFIITGDKELLDLKEFRGVRIVTASEFLKRHY